MWLADTSVWIQHFRKGEPVLEKRLAEGAVLMHPFVTGELACGNLQNRTEILSYLDVLPSAKVALDPEVRRLIEDRHLLGPRVDRLGGCTPARVGVALELPLMDPGPAARRSCEGTRPGRLTMASDNVE